MKRKVGFILLKCHDDSELTNYLQRKAEEGWWLSCVKGNRFIFERRAYEGRRICSYTFSSREPEIPTEIQLSRYLPQLRKNGWDTICFSGPENLVDNRRHVFLYEEKKGSPMPKCLDVEDEYALKCRKRKVFSNLLLCLLFELFIFIAIRSDLIRIVSSSSYLLFTLLFLISITACLCLSILSLAVHLKDKKERGSALRSGQYRFIDHSTRLISVIIIVAILLMVIDGIWGGSASRGERVRIGEREIRVYSDELPLKLEELGIENKGSYRSKRLVESKSFIGASYVHCYDEMLGTEGPEVYLISYTIFRSPSRSLRNAVERELVDFRSTEDHKLANELGVDRALVSSRAKLLVKGNDLLLVKSGFELSKDQLSVMRKLL